MAVKLQHQASLKTACEKMIDEFDVKAKKSKKELEMFMTGGMGNHNG